MSRAGINLINPEKAPFASSQRTASRSRIDAAAETSADAETVRQATGFRVDTPFTRPFLMSTGSHFYPPGVRFQACFCPTYVIRPEERLHMASQER